MNVLVDSMSVAPNIRFGLVARLCTNATGAELKSVSTEAGLFAIRARRRICEEGDYLKAVEKVINQGKKFSSTSLYSTYSKPRLLLRSVECDCRAFADPFRSIRNDRLETGVDLDDETNHELYHRHESDNIEKVRGSGH